MKAKTLESILRKSILVGAVAVSSYLAFDYKNSYSSTPYGGAAGQQTMNTAIRTASNRPINNSKPSRIDTLYKRYKRHEPMSKEDSLQVKIYLESEKYRRDVLNRYILPFEGLGLLTFGIMAYRTIKES